MAVAQATSYKETLEALLAAHNFLGGPAESELWQQWLDHNANQGRAEIQSLVHNRVRLEFKARAVAMLLLPPDTSLVFPWRPRPGFMRYLNGIPLMAKIIPPELREFTARLLIVNTGIVAAVMGNSDAEDALYRYGLQILGFLEVLPEDSPLAQDLLDAYPLGLTALLESRLPRGLKLKGDARMRSMILPEGATAVTGRKQVCLLGNYTREIGTLARDHGGQADYDVELFLSQIRWLLGLRVSDDFNLFQSWDLESTWAFLQGEERADLRRGFARHVIPRTPSLQQYALSAAQTLNEMLAEFEDDPETRFRILTALEGAGLLRQEDDRLRRAYAEIGEGILAKMRVPEV